MKSRRENLGRLLRHPGIHFLLLGSALFFGEGGFTGAGSDTQGSRRVLEISSTRVEQLSSQWSSVHQRTPTDSERDWLVRRWVEEEILYREALATGLDRADHSVCNRLILNMRFLGIEDARLADLETEMGTLELASRGERLPEGLRALCDRARELGLDRGDPVIRRQMAEMMRILLRRSTPVEGPSRHELVDYVARHPQRFRTPDRIRWNHVFLSRDRRGDSLVRDARRLLESLVASEAGPGEAARLGDSLPVHAPPELASERDLARRLGKAFARGVLEQPEERWSEPLRSAFGLHLVWIQERQPGDLRPWSEIEEEAREGLASEREEQGYAAALERLLGRWQVSRVEGDEA